MNLSNGSSMNRLDYSSDWIKKKYDERKQLTPTSISRDQISDFLVLIECIWRISNQDYQERIWVNHETLDIVDSYDDTTMYFLEDEETILKDRDERGVKMTDKQYLMLRKLYEMVEAFDLSLPYEEFSSHDKEIISDHRWPEIRRYAKLVYEELIKE